MRRFSFSLRQVLEFKQHTRLQIERQLAVKRRTHELMCHELSALEKRLDIESRIAKSSASPKTATVALQEIGRFLKQLRSTIDLQKSQVATLEEECQKIMRQHEQLAKEIEAMQSLRSQQWNAYQSKLKKNTQEQLTDMINHHWSAHSEVSEQDD